MKGATRALVLTLGAVLALSSNSATAALPSAPLPSVSVEGSVNALLRQGDSLYLGGDFASVTPWVSSAVALDGQGEPTTPVLPKIEGGAVHALAPDGAGGHFVGGSFLRIGGHAIARLAHVDATGAVVTTFSPAPDGPVLTLTVEGSSVFAGGTFTAIGGQSGTQRLAKLASSTGAVDTAFDPQPQGPVNALVHDGVNLFVGGGFFAVNGQQAPFLVKVSPASGDRDVAFVPSPDSTVHALAHDGTYLYAGGDFQIIAGSTANDRLAKLNPSTGAVLPPFAPNPAGTVLALRIHAGSLYAAGDFTDVGGQFFTKRLARLSLVSGTSDATFDPNPDAPVRALWSEGGTLYAGGDFVAIDGQSATPRLAKLNATDGTADLGFDPRPDGVVRSLSGIGATPIAGGDFHRAGTRANGIRNLARIDLATGQVDTTFTPNPSLPVHALVGDGANVYAGGSFTTIGAQAATPRVAKVDGLSGVVDTAFNPSPNGTVVALVRAGTSLFVAGSFSSIDAQSATAQLARVSTLDGSADPAFNPAPSNSGGVSALWHDGTSLFAGGGFRVIDGQSGTQRLAKLDPSNGTADLNFNPNVNFNPDLNSFSSGEVRTLWHDGTSLYAGGEYQSVDGEARTGLVKLSTSNGSADPAFAPNPGASSGGQPVRALWSDGASLFVGGRFNQIAGGGGAVTRLAQLNPGNAAVDLGFAPNPDEGVFALTGVSTTVFAAGTFDTAGGVEHEGLAIFGPPRPAATVPPGITGVARPGNTLTCGDGAWTDATLPFTRRWLRGGTAIGGQTATTYSVVASDVGQSIACEVTARNGTGPSSPSTSDAVVVQAVPITTPDPTPTVTPGISPAPSASPTATPSTTPTPGTLTLTASTALKRATISCKRVTRRRKRELRCTVRVPVGTPVASIRLTANAGKRVVARKTLRLRSRKATVTLPTTSRTVTLAIGGTKSVKRLRPR